MNTFLNIPTQLKSWLDYNGCLTDKVISLGIKVDVCLLNEAWDGYLFRRDVLIYCDDVPCWYGRTIIPNETFKMLAVRLNNLQDNPIGSILYKDPNITIKRRHLFKIKQKSLHYKKHLIVQNPGNLLWSRGSTFHVNTSPLYLIETFLPIFAEVAIFND